MGATQPRVGGRLTVPVYTLLLLAVAAVWGWTFVVVQDAIAAYGVVSFLAVRFALAVLVMAPFVARRMTKATALTGGAIGVLLAAAYLLQTFGLRTTTPTNSGLITGLFVIPALVWNRVLFGVRLSPRLWLMALVSLVGLVLLVRPPSAAPNTGDLLTLGCAVCFGAQIALLDRYAPRHHAGALALAQLAAAALVFVALWPRVEPVALPPAVVWPAIVLTAAVATALGFTMQTAAQRRLPAVRVALVLSMEPVFAALFGYWLAGDRLRPLQLAGAALMVAALLAATVWHVQEEQAGPTEAAAS